MSRRPSYPPKTRALKTPEDTILRNLVKEGTNLGWLTYHTHDSRRSPEGFPDLVMVRGNTMLAWELKSETGQPTRAQLTWVAALMQVTRLDVRVVRPEGLEDAYKTLVEAGR